MWHFKYQHFIISLTRIVHLSSQCPVLSSSRRPYLCSPSVQSTAFTVKENFLGSALQAHLRTHSGENLTGDPSVQSRFTRSSRLQVHLRTHSGEKSYSFLRCSKFYYVIWVASTFKNSYWGETLQLLPAFKVVYYVIWVASTFNLFVGETLKLIIVFKVVYFVIWDESTFKNSFWEKPYSWSQCSSCLLRHLGCKYI